MKFVTKYILFKKLDTFLYKITIFFKDTCKYKETYQGYLKTSIQVGRE